MSQKGLGSKLLIVCGLEQSLKHRLLPAFKQLAAWNVFPSPPCKEKPGYPHKTIRGPVPPKQTGLRSKWNAPDFVQGLRFEPLVLEGTWGFSPPFHQTDSAPSHREAKKERRQETEELVVPAMTAVAFVEPLPGQARSGFRVSERWEAARFHPLEDRRIRVFCLRVYTNTGVCLSSGLQNMFLCL